MNFEEFHMCHFCGEYVNGQGYTAKNERHFLSDCRPDLVEHEIGAVCTWSFRRKPLEMANGTVEPAFPIEETCYAYQDKDRNWTKEHIHFYPDGPM
jgi:hypothetical protein